MAVPTFTLLNHQLLTTADTSTGWIDLTLADADVKVEGANSMSGVLRADGEQAYYDSGTAPVSAAGKTVRGWINVTTIAYMGTFAGDPYKLLAFDGSTTELKPIFGSDTYPGGWFNYIWSMDDFTTLTLANVRRWGVESGHASNARNVTNAWMDVIRYLDGYSMVGGTSGDKVRLGDIATLDKVDAYNVVFEYEGVYYGTGTIQFGTGATTHFFEMNGQVLVFIDKTVAAGLYRIAGVGSGTNILITGSVLRSTGAGDNTRFVIDFSEANLASLTFTNNLVARASTITFKSGQTATGNIFEDCDQVTHGGADMSGSVVRGYEGTVGTAAMVYNETSDISGTIEGSTFTKGTAATHAIEFGTSSPTTISLSDIEFNGYNGTNGQNDSAVYFARPTGTVTVNLSGVTGFSYRSAGATINAVASTTLTLTGLYNPSEVRVYQAGTTNEIAGQEIVSSGTFTTGIDSATYPSVDIRIGALNRKFVELYGVDVTSDTTIPIQQIDDSRGYLNPP